MSTAAPKPVPNDAPAHDGVPTAPTAVPRPIWPFLLAIALVAGLAELAYAVVNVSTLPVFLDYGLGLPKLVGFSLTAFYLSEAVFNSPMGSLADHLGRRRLMVAGCAVSVATCLGTSFLRIPNGGGAATYLGIAALIGMRILDGAGAAALWPAVFASIGDRVAPQRQAAAMSVLNIAYIVGLAFGPLVGGFVNRAFAAGFRVNSVNQYTPAFWVAALLFAMAAGLAYLVAPSKSQQQATAEQHAAEGAEAGVSEAAAQQHGAFSLGAVKSALRRIPVLMLLVFLTFLAVGLIAPNVKLFVMENYHLIEKHGVSEAEVLFGKLLLYPALLIAALSVPMGRLGDVWGKTRSIKVGMGLCALSLWLILLVKSEWSVVVLGSLLGIGFVLAFPSYMALLSDLTGPSERGGIIGAVRMAQGVGAMVGAPLGSVLYVHMGKLSPFLAAGGLLTAAFALALFFIHEPRTNTAAAQT